MTKGIDVSNNNGEILWTQTAPEIDFACVKASESTDFKDEFAAQNAAALHAAGKPVIWYHFGRPSHNSGHDEAGYFMDCIGEAGGIKLGDSYALDIEDTNVPPTADLLAYCLDFFQRVEAALGFKGYLYSGHWYMEPHNLEGHPELGAYPLWYASYQGALPPVPAGWSAISIWQYSASGVVPGVAGLVDLDSYLGTDTEWTAHCWGGQPDPLAGKAVYVADLPASADVPTILHHVSDLLSQPNPNLGTIKADVDLARTKFGLVT